MRKWMVLLLLVVGAEQALACSCLRQDEDLDVAVRKAFDEADSVVLATVQSIRRQNTEHPLGDKRYAEESEITQFVTQRSWKGSHGARFETEIVTTCCLCGMSFEEQRTYLLYLTGPNDAGRYSTSICSRSTLEGRASADLERLNALAHPGGQPSPERRDEKHNTPEGLWRSVGYWLGRLFRSTQANG